MSANKIIIHSDLNNFFASVECLKDPNLKSVPVAVAGNTEERHGIILAKNIPAAAYGIKTGEPIWSAKSKCPALVTVPPSYDDYIIISDKVRKIYSKYSDRVEAFGIDECWLDVSNIASSIEEGKELADNIREEIKNTLGITVSCGVSFNKVFAKLGSDIKKPDATTVISKRNFKETVWPLPVEALLFVGRSTKRTLLRINITTIGDLALSDPNILSLALGKNGVLLWSFANGLDCSEVSHINSHTPIKSVGNSVTTYRDLVCEDDVKLVLYELCESVSFRLRKLNCLCKTVQLHVRECDLRSYERQSQLSFPARTVQGLFDEAYSLYSTHHVSGKPIRSLGIRASELLRDDAIQLSIDTSVARAQRTEQLNSATDSIRMQFGKNSIFRAIMLTDSSLSINATDKSVCSFSR